MVSSTPSTGGQPIEPHYTSLEKASDLNWKSPEVTGKVRAYIQKQNLILPKQDMDELTKAKDSKIERIYKKLEQKTSGFKGFFRRIFDRKSFLKDKDQLSQLDELKNLITSCKEVIPTKTPAQVPQPEATPVSREEIPVSHEETPIPHKETPPPVPRSETIFETPTPIATPAEAIPLPTDSLLSAPPPIAAASPPPPIAAAPPPPPITAAPPPPPPATLAQSKPPDEIHREREIRRLAAQQNNRANPNKSFYSQIETKDPSRWGMLKGLKQALQLLQGRSNPAIKEDLVVLEKEIQNTESALVTLQMINKREEAEKILKTYTNDELKVMAYILFSGTTLSEALIKQAEDPIKAATEEGRSLIDQEWAKAFTESEQRKETWQQVLGYHTNIFVTVLKERYENPTLEPKYEPKPYKPAGKTSPERSQEPSSIQSKPAAEFDPSQIFAVRLKKRGSDEGIQRPGSGGN